SEYIAIQVSCFQYLGIDDGELNPFLHHTDFSLLFPVLLIFDEQIHFRVLPVGLEFLHLSFCGLSYHDFKFLSECPQANQLKLLNISNNPMHWEDSEPFYNFLQNNSNTLQHLAISHCLLADSTISVLISTLSHCSQLRILNFSSNPITMPMLIRVPKHLTSLVQLNLCTMKIKHSSKHSFDNQKKRISSAHRMINISGNSNSIDLAFHVLTETVLHRKLSSVLP
ncbi:hypothetical protein STEG23_003525, partial [Scotinomys teguina]